MRAARQSPSSIKSRTRGRRAGFQDVLVVSGYGLRVAVERSHLVIEDGLADRRGVRRLSRIDRRVQRIAIIGHAGTISLDAIRWLHDVKLPLVHLDTDGRVLALVAPDSPDHPTLRRAQARAVDTEAGLAIMRDLLRQKLDGQEQVLRSFTAGQLALPPMELARRALSRATDYVGLRVAEAQAAAAYWNAWTTLPVRFRGADRDQVPQYWLTFGPRASALSGSPRLAVNPANAMLNYLYAILEAEARLALLAVGCDPGVGIQHADQKARDSMACDVMEAVRPKVDAWLVEYLATRVLRRQDFLELRTGQCRLMSDLAKELAQTAALWVANLGPVVESVAQHLYTSATAPGQSRRWAQHKPQSRKARRPLPTPLTEQRRSQGRPQVAARPPAAPEPSLPETRSLLIARKERAAKQMTKDDFLRHVVPVLRTIPAARIAAAVGLSEKYCAKIRAGRGVPHLSHWEAFARVGRITTGRML